MRKIVFMMMLSLLLFTQCKKENVGTNAEEMVPIRLEVPIIFKIFFAYHSKTAYNFMNASRKLFKH